MWVFRCPRQTPGASSPGSQMPGTDRLLKIAISPALASHSKRDVPRVKDYMNHLFHFLYSGALISRAWLTLEGLLLPESASSRDSIQLTPSMLSKCKPTSPELTYTPPTTPSTGLSHSELPSTRPNYPRARCQKDRDSPYLYPRACWNYSDPLVLSLSILPGLFHPWKPRQRLLSTSPPPTAWISLCVPLWPHPMVWCAPSLGNDE